ISPALRSKLTPSSARTPGKDFVIDRISRRENAMSYPERGSRPHRARPALRPPSRSSYCLAHDHPLAIASGFVPLTIFQLLTAHSELLTVSAIDPSARSYKRLPACDSRL